MKKIFLTILYLTSFFAALAKKNKIVTLVGFQVGAIAPMSKINYAIPKYKLGLQSFSYAASIENRFTLHYKLNFSLQYSLSYFNVMQRNIEHKIAENEQKNKVEKNEKSQFSSNLTFNSIYKITKNCGLTAGIGIAKPIDFIGSTAKAKEFKMMEIASKNSQKFSPIVSPFFIIGIENNCNIFRRNLIYSVQYNIGFMPNKNLPVESISSSFENQYSHGVQIGLKYKY